MFKMENFQGNGSSNDYLNLFQKIINVDPKIRFVTILDSEGRLMAGGQREGITNYLSPDAERKSLRHALEAWQVRSQFSDSIGEGKYAFAEYEKIKRITIPLDKKHIIYMTTEVDAEHTNIINKILKLKSEWINTR